MTPAERIAAELERGPVPRLDVPFIALDTLCPKGESIKLDRTGDTDRLVRQRHEQTPAGRDVWADIEDSTEGAPA